MVQWDNDNFWKSGGDDTTVGNNANLDHELLVKIKREGIDDGPVQEKKTQSKWEKESASMKKEQSKRNTYRDMRCWYDYDNDWYNE